jgi:predicted RNA-binding Zn ribbon-like protein
MIQVGDEDNAGRRTALALDLVNTWDPFFPEPERLRRPADLAAFLADQGIAPGEAVGKLDLETARALRGRLRAALESGDAGRIAATLNELLDGAAVRTRLVGDGADGWRIEVGPESSTPPIDRLAVEAALGLAEAIATHGVERLRVCAAAPCREAFLDTSRNRSRRFCSDRCASRFNVAAYRARRRAE